MIALAIGIVAGLIALSPAIISRRPDARELLGKLAPYTGWVGMCLFGWGVWELISAVMNLGTLSSAPIHFIFWITMAATDFLLGLLLGFGLISKYALGKSEVAVQKGAALRQKIAPFQAVLGVVEIIVSVLFFVL
jgi:hypothetical protein